MRNLFACVTFLAACGGSGSSVETELVGVYTLTTWTNNSTGCAAEGPSILETESDKAIFVEVGSLFGQDFLQAVTCLDVADCQTKAAGDTIFLDGFAFEGGSDGAGWTGGTFAGSIANGMCDGTLTEFTMTGPTADTLKITQESLNPPPFPTDADGFCDIEDARRAAGAQPCEELEVLTATFAADL